MGTRFIASAEANAVEGYKEMVTSSSAKDVVYTNLFTGVHGNYLGGSITNAGLDPTDLPESGKDAMTFGSDREKKKAWKDIWGAGQGVGSIDSILPTAEIVDRLDNEYRAALGRL
jgi:nitronate monooxygenase